MHIVYKSKPMPIHIDEYEHNSFEYDKWIISDDYRESKYCYEYRIIVSTKKTIKDYNDNVRNNVPIEGYKLPLRNIRDVKSYSFGQAGMSGIFVFIDKENNASVMKVDYDYSSGDKIVVKDINLYKNVANNIISSIDEYNGNSRNFYLIDKDNNYYVFK